jgi:arabinofuranosyltransferase
VRPDLGLVTVAVLAGVVLAQWRDDTFGSRARLLAAAFALPVAYQVFRMGYYATLVPNTALAKGAERARWAAGWSYLEDLVGPYRLTIPAVLLAVAVAVPLLRRAAAAGRRPLVAVVALPVAGLLDLLYVVRAGGDYMHARLLLPGLWAFVAPFAVTPVPAWRALRSLRPVALGRAMLLAGLVVWAGLCAGVLRHERTTIGGGTWVVEGRQLLVHGTGVAHPITIADHGWGPNSPYRRLAPADAYIMGVPLDIDAPAGLRTPVYAAFGVGATGFGLGPEFHILDMLGLGDPLVSRFRVDREGIVAHEKGLPRSWQAALLSDGPLDPELLQDPAIVIPLYLSPDGELDRDIRAAREALGCTPIQDLYDAVREPLTVGRFLENVAAAPHLTSLRIPPAPAEATAELCD